MMQMQLQRHAFALRNGNPTQRAPLPSPQAITMKAKAQMREIQFHSLLKWVDDVKEGGMRKKKSVYSHEDWVIHRSSTRHIRHFMSSLSSRVILSLIPPVCIFTGIAALVGAYNTAVGEYGFLSLPLLHASSLPYQLTAPALALLLVFRTEASYARYKEGRKEWTRIIGLVTDFARQANAGIQHLDDTQLKHQLLDNIMAFPFALKVLFTSFSSFYNAWHDWTKLVLSEQGIFVLSTLICFAISLAHFSMGEICLMNVNTVLDYLSGFRA